MPRRSRLLVSFGVLALVSSACAARVAAPSDPATQPPTSAPTSSPSRLPTEEPVTPPDTRSIVPSATIDVGRRLNGMVITEDAVWVGSPKGLTRVDPTTNEADEELPVPNLAGYFTIGFNAAWVVDYEASLVRRVDLESGAVLAEIPSGANPEGIGLTEDAVWVANHRDGTISRIDPATNTLAASIRVGAIGPGGPQHLVTSADAVWSGVPNAGIVVRLDPANGKVVAEIPTTPTPCGEMLLTGDQLWVSSCESSISVIDTRTNEEIGVVYLLGTGGGMFERNGHVWATVLGATSKTPGRLKGIDVETLEIVDVIETEPGSYPAGLAFGSAWIPAEQEGLVHRYPESSLTDEPPLDSIDALRGGRVDLIPTK